MATLNANPTIFKATSTSSQHTASSITSNLTSLNSSLQHIGVHEAVYVSPFDENVITQLQQAWNRHGQVEKAHQAVKTSLDTEYDDKTEEAIDQEEIFELLRHINDPEHPLTLEALNVVQKSLITIQDEKATYDAHSQMVTPARHTIDINFTPTIPHCSMATLIGLCLRVKLLRSLPTRFKVMIKITPGTHASEDAINKQLNDKERVAAALENNALLDVVHKCLDGSDPTAYTPTQLKEKIVNQKKKIDYSNAF